MQRVNRKGGSSPGREGRTVKRRKASKRSKSGRARSGKKKTLRRYSTLSVVTLTPVRPSATSYSPSVNKMLTKRKATQYTDVFGCGLGDILQRRSPRYGQAVGEPQVMVASGECVGWSTTAGKHAMLTNLNQDKVNCTMVIAPLQKHSNCWFNTMFMTFFISDKGRKFFKFFREQMIKGIHYRRSGKGFASSPILPRSLAKAFFLLNAAVDASLHGGLSDSTGRLMDTNNLISMIHKAISHKAGSPVKAPYESGNPIDYYMSIVNYLGGGSANQALRLAVVDSLSELRRSALLSRKPPDVVAVHTDEDQEYVLKKSMQVKNAYGGVYTYEIDSIVVRDTEQRHFCALLSCNGKGFGFDGASFARMSRFDWKKRFGKGFEKEKWSFQGSKWGSSDKKILWQLSNAYSISLYYRVA